jgi:hypothetical protein
MADNIPPREPWRFDKAKLNRWQFITLSLALGILSFAAIISLVYFAPAYAPGLVAIFAFLLIIAGYVLRMLRLNDISPDTQMKFWKSGNMFFVGGWMRLLAPSSSSSEGSLDEVVSSPEFSSRGERMKLIGRNFLRWFIVYIVLMAIIFGYWQYSSWSTEQRVLNQPSTSANVVLSLGNNESTTLSMTVPGGYVGGDQSGAGTIFPTSSLDRETPSIGFYSQPATLANINSLKQQTILDTETQIHYADSDKLTVDTATGTFLGYPALVMTSKSDRPSKTIVFRIGSSTNMIEIRIIYSSSNPASEQQVVDDILSSIKSSNNSDATSAIFSVVDMEAASASTTASQNDNSTASIAVLSPSGGETWQIGQEQTVKWSSVGVKYISIYIDFPNGTLCAVHRGGDTSRFAR